MDVSTACHLGTCAAIKASEAVPLVNSFKSQLQDSFISCSQLETALRVTGLGKRSKQCFLKITCMDNTIKRSRKGAGGNTVAYKCLIIKQSEIPENILKGLHEGNKVRLATVPLCISSFCLQ